MMTMPLLLNIALTAIIPASAFVAPIVTPRFRLQTSRIGHSIPAGSTQPHYTVPAGSTQPRCHIARRYGSVRAEPCMKLSARGSANLLVLGTIVTFAISTVDVVEIGLNVLGGALKFGWRLFAFLFFVQLVIKAVVATFMAGGPIRALKRAFFGMMAKGFNALSTLLSRLRFPGDLPDSIAELASQCEDRSGGPGLAGMLGGDNPFGGGANPFSAGAGSFEDFLKTSGAAGFAGGAGASPFGGGASPFGGGASPFGGGATPGASSSNPPSPFTASSSTPGVTIKVRSPGGSSSGNAADPPSRANSDSVGGQADVIDVEGTQSD